MNFKRLSLLCLLLVFFLSSITVNANSLEYRDNIYCCETVAQQAWYTKLIKLDNFNRKDVSGTLNFKLVPYEGENKEYVRKVNSENEGQIDPEECGGQIDPEECGGQLGFEDEGGYNSDADDRLPPGSGGDEPQKVTIVKGVTEFSYKVPFSSNDYVDEKFNELALKAKDPAGNSLELFNHAFVHEWGRIDTPEPNGPGYRVGRLYPEQFNNKSLNLSEEDAKAIYSKQKQDSQDPKYKLSWLKDPDTEDVVGWQNPFGKDHYNSDEHLHDFLGDYKFGSEFLNKYENFRNGSFNVVKELELNHKPTYNFYLSMTTRPIAISKTYDARGNIKSIEKPLIPSKDAYSFIQKHNDSLMKEGHEDVDGYVMDKVFRYELIEESPEGIDLKPSEKHMIVDVSACGDLLNDIHVFEDEASADKFYTNFFENLDEGLSMDASILHDAFVFSEEYKAQLVNIINGYTIVVDPNGGNWNGDTAKMMKNTVKGDIFILPEAPKKDGYKFLYWKGSKYQPGQKYVVQGDHTFIAEWKKDDSKDIKSNPNTGDSCRTTLYFGFSLLILISLLIVFKKKICK